MLPAKTIEAWYDLPVTELYPAFQKERDPVGGNNVTWYVVAAWLRENVGPSDLARLFMHLFEKLTPITQADEDTPEGVLADCLRDTMDPIWLAMDDGTHELVNKLVCAMDEEILDLDEQPH